MHSAFCLGPSSAALAGLEVGFAEEVIYDMTTDVAAFAVLQWHGWIKDYDGGTLMEGRIHPTLAFTRFPQMLRVQRQALDGAIRTLSRRHIVYPGLCHASPDGQGLAISISQIPGEYSPHPHPCSPHQRYALLLACLL